MEFNERLSEIMKARKLTAYSISDATGISDSLIGYYKRGEKQPTKDNLIKLADYLDVTVDYLVGRTNKTQEKSPHSTSEDAEKELLISEINYKISGYNPQQRETLEQILRIISSGDRKGYELLDQFVKTLADSISD